MTFLITTIFHFYKKNSESYLNGEYESLFIILHQNVIKLAIVLNTCQLERSPPNIDIKMQKKNLEAQN